MNKYKFSLEKFRKKQKRKNTTGWPELLDGREVLFEPNAWMSSITIGNNLYLVSKDWCVPVKEKNHGEV